MDLYFERHDGEAATVEDFLKVFEDASGRDLSQFALWYHQAGTPNLTITAGYNAEASELVLEVEQSVPPTPSESRKRLMHIPLAFGLVGKDGKDIDYGHVDGAAVENGVLHVRKRRHTVRFADIKERPALSLNRGFSAPITLSIEQTQDERAFLARHDSDDFSRWQAFNALLTEALMVGSRQVRGGKPAEYSGELTSLAGTIAANDALQPAFRALALALPGEADIARELGANIDPDAIFAAREALAKTIAGANEILFERLHTGLAVDKSFSPDAASAGRRALRNALLDYLSTADPARAAKQFQAADNMTDRAAALMILAHRHGETPEAAEALKAFEARYHADALVLDKWFQIQASIPGPRTIERVRALMQHPAFSIANPNRVRSLVGTFSTGNQTGFHRADGAGYMFFAETILEVEKRNPQVAARLATGFRSWRSLEPVRQERAREALAKLAGTPNLSADLRDIIERTLA
jgi:aminopeptidase N